MKKTYIQPSTQVMTIAIQQMICESSANAGPNISGTTSNTSDLLSRRSGLWDDEEDDDY